MVATLPKLRFSSSIYYENPNIKDSRECIFIGGKYDNSSFALRSCLKFNVDTLEFSNFGNIAYGKGLHQVGVIRCAIYSLIIFGGFDGSNELEQQIEKHNMVPGTDFQYICQMPFDTKPLYNHMILQAKSTYDFLICNSSKPKKWNFNSEWGEISDSRN